MTRDGVLALLYILAKVNLPPFPGKSFGDSRDSLPYGGKQITLLVVQPAVTRNPTISQILSCLWDFLLFTQRIWNIQKKFYDCLSKFFHIITGENTILVHSPFPIMSLGLLASAILIATLRTLSFPKGISILLSFPQNALKSYSFSRIPPQNFSFHLYIQPSS